MVNLLVSTKRDKKEKIILIIGLVAFILGFIWSSFNFGSLGIAKNFYSLNAISVSTSSGIIYFFTFTSITSIIFYILKKISIKSKDWVWFTLGYYTLTYLMGLSILKIDKSNILALIGFPLLYSPFIVTYSAEFLKQIGEIFSYLMPILFNLFSIIWFYLEFFDKKIKNLFLKRSLKLILLSIIFLILVIGTHSCMVDIYHG